MKHSYTNNSSKVLNSLSSFRLQGEISSLINRFLTPIVVRNDGNESTYNNFKQSLVMLLFKSKPYLLLILCLCITSLAAAQPPDTGGDVDVPIDGGLSLLVAAGVGYGAKQLRKKKKVD